MRMKLLVFAAMALALSSVAYADIVINFSSPVSTVSFYSSEPFNLTATTNGTTGLNLTVNSGYALGAVTGFADTNVTKVDFSGTPNFYVLDDFTYSVGGSTYVLNFDTIFPQGRAVTTQYAGWAGGPVFSGTGGNQAVILTYPNYNYSGYPYESFPNVIFEGVPFAPAPEPGTLAMFGTGVVGLAGLIRRKLNS